LVASGKDPGMEVEEAFIAALAASRRQQNLGSGKKIDAA
jgi:hypothetical protein